MKFHSSPLRKGLSLLLFMLMAVMTTIAQDYYQVQASELNVRQSPSKNAAVMGKLYRGQEVTVYEISGTWARIEYGGTQAWASAKYLEGPIIRSDSAGSETEPVGTTEKEDSAALIWFWLSVLLAVPILVEFFKSKDHDDLKKPNKFYIYGGTIMALSVSELLYMATYPGDLLWFVYPSEVGWIMMVVNFMLFGLLVVAQTLLFCLVILSSNFAGRRNVDYSVGFYGWVGGIVAIGVCGMISKSLVPVAIVLFAIAQLVQIGIMVKANNKYRGDVNNLVFTIALYIVGMTVCTIMIFAFLALLLVAVVAMVILGVMAASDKVQVSLGHPSSGKGRVYDQYGISLTGTWQGDQFYGDDGRRYHVPYNKDRIHR